MEDGRKITGTADHKVLTQEGWKEIQELTNQDYIMEI